MKKNIIYMIFCSFLLCSPVCVFCQEISELTDLSLEYTLDDNNIICFNQKSVPAEAEMTLQPNDQIVDKLIKQAITKQKNHSVYDEQYAIDSQSLHNKILFSLGKYYYFPKHNAAYQNKITEKKLAEIIKQAKAKTDFSEKSRKISASEMRELVLNKLNIRQLVRQLDQQFLNVTCAGVIDQPGYTQKKLIFDNLPVGRFEVMILIPKKQASKFPAIIGLHGHGQSAEKFLKDFSIDKFAEQGFIVIIPSFRAMALTEIEYIISKKLLLYGFSLMGIRVYETLLVVSYLKSLDIVDLENIGVIAHSGGSSIAAFLKVLVSIKVVVSDHQSSFIDLTDLYGIYDEIIPDLAEYARYVHNYNNSGYQLNVEYGQLKPENNILWVFEEYLK